MLGHINCELNDSDVIEVTEGNASNEADQTNVNHHTNRMLQLALSSTNSIQSASVDTLINL